MEGSSGRLVWPASQQFTELRVAEDCGIRALTCGRCDCGIAGMWPSLMRCAVVIIRLCPAWRKTPVNRTTGTMPLSIRLPSTLPGPTDGSGRALKSGLKSRAQSAQSCHADSKSFERWDAT